MSPVTTANSDSAATGKTWFKVYEDPPVYTKGSGLTFPSQSITSFKFTIPKSVPSGQYLVRFEQIALHVASSYGGAQGECAFRCLALRIGHWVSFVF